MAKRNLFGLSLFGRKLSLDLEQKHNQRITGDGVLQLDSHERDLIAKLFGNEAVNGMCNKKEFIELGYASNVDIYSIVKKIVQTASAMKYKTRNKLTGEDTNEEARLQEINPLKGYSWEQYLELALTNLLTCGDCFQYKMSSTGFGIQAVDVLPSQYTCINTNNSFFDPVRNYTLDFDTINQTFKKEEIVHTKYNNPSFRNVEQMVYGLSPIQVASMVVRVGLDRWEADASLLHNKGAIGLLTNRSDITLPKPQADELQREWNEDTAGAHNFGKVKVTGKNVDFVQLAMSSTDLQLLEKDVVTLRAACNVYGFPSVLLNDNANSTYNNVKEATKALYNNAVMPNLELFLTDFNNDIAPQFFGNENIEVYADYSDVEALQDDINEKAKTAKILVDSGIQSPLQASEFLKLEQPDQDAERAASGGQNQNENI